MSLIVGWLSYRIGEVGIDNNKNVFRDTSFRDNSSRHQCSCLSENIDPLPAIYVMIVCLVISCVLFVCMNERVGGEYVLRAVMYLY